MALASSSTAQLAYLEESTYGTIPSGTPKKLRMTGEDLGFDYTTNASAEINAGRQTPDSIVTDASAGGGINFELSYREYDAFFEALLGDTFNTFGTGGVKTLTVTFATAGNTVTDDGVDGFAGLAAGQWIYIANAATAGNNGWKRIASRTDDQLTLDASTPVVANGSADEITVSSTRLANGTDAMRSFCIEQQFTDVGMYFMHKGRVPSSLSLNLAVGSMVTGSIGFMGSTTVRADATQFPGGAASASQSYGVMNCVTGLGGIYLRGSGGSSLLTGTYVQSLQLNIDGKLRGQKALGVLGNAGIGLGTFEMTGTASIYLVDGTLYDEALAQNLCSLTFPLYDASYNGYAITFENVKLGVPKVSAGAKDQDVLLSVPITVVAPSSTDFMIYIDRCGAAIS